MEKIKNVLSHGSKKEHHGEGSHLRDAHTTQGTATGESEYHPIYDQFATQGQSAASNNPSHTTGLNPSEAGKGFGPSVTDGLGPHGNLGQTDENSTASIKSGVMGLPQGSSHPSGSSTQSNTVLPDRTATSQQHGSSHLGRDAALGTAALGGAGAGLGHGLHRQKDHDDLRAPGETVAQDPTLTTETDRSFPLAGGVTSRSHAEQPHAGGQLGSSDRGAGVMDAHGHDHGRRGLAEAAAAASDVPKYSGDPCASDNPSSTANFVPGPHKTDTANALDPKLHIPGEFPETPMETPGGREHDRAEFLPRTNRQSELDSRNPEQTTSQDHHGLGKAAGVGAAGVGAAGLGYAAGKHHHREPADIESATTNNPYSAKKVDPRLDPKPRGFEDQKFDPTARTEPSPHATGHDTGLAHRAADERTPHVPGKEHEKDHHYGRNAGLAGAGAAAAGGFYAANHRDNKAEPSPAGYQTSPTAATGTTPTSQHSTPQQTSQVLSEPERKDHHYGRDAGLVGAGAAGAGGLHHALHRDEKPGAAAQTYPSQATQAGMGQPPMAPQYSTAQQDTQIPPHADEKDHHYGRNAGLAGTGAAAAGGLYYANKHDDKPDSGPASATIGPHKSNVANVMDPRVKPDPALQGSHAKHQGVMGSSGMPGTGADDVVQRYGENRATHPSASLDNQRYDPSAPGAHDPRKASTDHHHQDHHHGRDAALGAGAGALGYEATKHHGHDDSHHAAPGTTRDSTSHHEHHHGRNAALGAGAGAAGHEVMKHDHDSHHDSRHRSTGNTLDSASRNPETATSDLEGASHTGRTGATPAGVKNYPPEHYPSRNYPPQNYPVNKRVVAAAAGPDPHKGESHLGELHERHHHGGDAALAAGAGVAAGEGMHEAAKHREGEAAEPHVHYGRSHDAATTQGASSESNLGQASHGSQIPVAGESAPYDQQRSEHHHGRNAGLAAGAGAAGAGLYGASKHHGNDAHHAPEYQQHTYPPQAGQMNQAAQPGQSSQIPVASGYAPQGQERSQHHYGRDAGLAAGAGAAGAGLYGASKHHGDAAQQPAYSAQQPGYDAQQPAYGAHQPSSQQYPTQPGYQQSTYPQQGETAPSGTQNQAYDMQANRENDHHFGRDAALATGAAGAGAYGYNKHQDKAAEKELAHERKLEQRELEKQERTAQPAYQPTEATQGTPEKKHGLFHRKSKSISKSPEHSPRTSLEAAETTGRTSLEGGRNKLHKDPPRGHPAWEVLGNKQQGPQHIGADGRPDKHSQDDHIHSGYYEAPHPNDQGRFMTNPETGIAGNVDAHGSAPYGAGATGFDEGAERYRG